MENDSYAGVMRLSQEKPEWILVLKLALDYAEKINNTGFAGAWINSQMHEKHGVNIGNLRTLKSYGIIEVVSKSRGGNRAYYKIVDIEKVKNALSDLEYKDKF